MTAGYQRQVVSFERVRAVNGEGPPRWLAVLTCGHTTCHEVRRFDARYAGPRWLPCRACSLVAERAPSPARPRPAAGPRAELTVRSLP